MMTPFAWVMLGALVLTIVGCIWRAGSAERKSK